MSALIASPQATIAAIREHGEAMIDALQTIAALAGDDHSDRPFPVARAAIDQAVAEAIAEVGA